MPAIEKLIKARALYVRGMRQVDIAMAMGVTQKTISLWVRATLDPSIIDELERRKDEPEDVVIQDVLSRLKEEPAPLSEDEKVQLSVELERTEDWLRLLDPIIQEGTSDKKVWSQLHALDRALRIQESRRKLLGLDRPAQVKLDAKASVDFTVDGIDPSQLT